MLNWFIYNSLLPLLPVPLVYFAAWLIGTRKRIMSILRDGQFCFYCTSLAASCINDIFKSGRPIPASQMSVAIALLIFCLILSTFTYGVAATAPAIVPMTAESETSAAVSRADEVKLGLASIATALATTLIVLVVRFMFGLVQCWFVGCIARVEHDMPVQGSKTHDLINLSLGASIGAALGSSMSLFVPLAWMIPVVGVACLTGAALGPTIGHMVDDFESSRRSPGG